jgi:presenilin-like A22 family membrane protease
MTQRLIVDAPDGEDVVVAFGETPQDVEDETIHIYATVINPSHTTDSGVVINSSYTTDSGVVDSSMFLVGGLVIEDIPTIIGILFSVLLMILLYVHSEWYVVNTVGILVGSGVIVMLGVSFVPTLIMVFMIAAAIYDAWAVYKSKHMLDLADTMMNLNLPILLVAPQDSDYTMRTERMTVHDANDADDNLVPQVAQERVVAKSNDAMLMGLGDVIFPGMLVLSTIQYVGGDSGLLMAMTTLVGSLIGYSILMYYVGKGQAQAGLPLLNGGAILGYVIGGLLTIGMAMFQFNISF